MNKVFLLLLLICFHSTSAQDSVFYVAAKTGLNMRAAPQQGATLVGRIPYGEKIIVDQTHNDNQEIVTEGFTGYWRKVSYNNKTGYIIDSYLLPVPPPKAGVGKMQDYLSQISSAFGTKLVIKKGDEETGSELHKQLFKNGSEWHEFRGYEYGSDTYFLPDFTMQQGFLLVRLIGEFQEAFGEKDEFPTKNKTFRKGAREYSIKTEKEVFDSNSFIKRIMLEFEDGAIYNFEMYQIDQQLVIFYGSGV